MEIMLNLKMKLDPPAHRASSSSGPQQQPAGADYSQQQPGRDRNRNRPSRVFKTKTSEGGQDFLKPFPSLPPGQWPAIMPPPPPVESGKGKGGKGGDKTKGKGKGKGNGSPWA